jgi:hypothetical protein
MHSSKHTVQYITIPIRKQFWSQAKRLANVIYDQNSATLGIDEEKQEITLRIVDPNQRTDSYVHIIARMCKSSALSCWVGPSVYTYGFIGGSREQKAQAYLAKLREVMTEKQHRFSFIKGLGKAITQEWSYSHVN